MSRNDFKVTYEIVTPESAEIGDVAARGFVKWGNGCTLREGLSLLLEFEAECIEASESPFVCPRWLTQVDKAWHNGSQMSRSLHFPESLTASTRRRIARLAGMRVP